jgi:hypothetical protein
MTKIGPTVSKLGGATAYKSRVIHCLENCMMDRVYWA